MNFLLSVSRLIDALNERVGRTIYWLILVAVLVSAGNAVVRYAFNRSSNAWLEIQWYLFSAVFLFCAGYTLLHNQHVRIDVITGRLSKRALAWIDVFGTLLFGARDRVDMPAPGDVRPARLRIELHDLIWEGMYQPIAVAVGFSSERLNRLQFLTIRRYLSLVFATLVALLLVLAIWS